MLAVSLNPNSRGKQREVSIDNATTLEDHSCFDIGNGSKNGTSEQEIATGIHAHVI